MPAARRGLIDELQSRISAIEHGASATAQPHHAPPRHAAQPSPGWTTGAPAFDAILPGGGLALDALCEVKPATHGDWPAALAFAACLAVRRRLGASAGGQDGALLAQLWCLPRRFTAEHGGLHGAGLADLGLVSEGLVAVEAERETDVLWALEEGVRSRSLALAVGVLREADLTPSRRLGLAAAAGRTPILLLTLPERPAAPTAAVRFGIRRRASAPHPCDGRAPGAPRFGLTLERCRGRASVAEGSSLDLEWCHVTHRFHLVAGLADRAHAPAVARMRA